MPHGAPIKILTLILANLLVGNVTLYVHEIWGRQQSEVSPSLWISFSVVSILVLLLCSKILQKKKSFLLAVVLSLVASFFIPTIGFSVAMGFSLKALIIGSIYLSLGFLSLILPMFILNLLLFRWLQRCQIS